MPALNIDGGNTAPPKNIDGGTTAPPKNIDGGTTAPPKNTVRHQFTVADLQRCLPPQPNIEHASGSRPDSSTMSESDVSDVERMTDEGKPMSAEEKLIQRAIRKEFRRRVREEREKKKAAKQTEGGSKKMKYDEEDSKESE
jgi:hypothetical protein